MKPRPEGCQHGCLKPCHPGPCPPCKQMIRIKCHCGLNQPYVACKDWIIPENREQLQSCGNQCPNNVRIKFFFLYFRKEEKQDVCAHLYNKSLKCIKQSRKKAVLDLQQNCCLYRFCFFCISLINFYVDFTYFNCFFCYNFTNFILLN